MDDMIMSPTYTRDAADMVKSILEKSLPFGIYHVSNSGQCSWYEFAKVIFDTIGINANLTPTKTSISQSKAKRPMFSALTSVKLNKYDFKMENWRSALRNYLMEKEYLK